jgi:hypothetical protein
MVNRLLMGCMDAVALGLTEHQGLRGIKGEALLVVRVRAVLGWGQSHITPFCPQPSQIQWRLKPDGLALVIHVQILINSNAPCPNAFNNGAGRLSQRHVGAGSISTAISVWPEIIIAETAVGMAALRSSNDELRIAPPRAAPRR